MISFNADRIARDVIVIGASAGGSQAVTELLSRLPGDLPAFIGVVIHRGAKAPADWSTTLGRRTKLRVIEPAAGASLTPGTVYIAPSNRHMTFEHGKIVLDDGAKQHFTRPAVDPLFTSAARSYGRRVVGVILTGGGHDGLQGLLDICANGGLALAQKPSESKDPEMPEHSIRHDHVKGVLTVDEIGDALVRLVHGDACSYPPA